MSVDPSMRAQFVPDQRRISLEKPPSAWAYKASTQLDRLSGPHCPL